MPTMKANAVAAGAIASTRRAPITMRLNTSRARLSPPSRYHWSVVPVTTEPGTEFFIPDNWPSGSKVMIRSAKSAVNTQNITMPKPNIPTGLSNSLP